MVKGVAIKFVPNDAWVGVYWKRLENLPGILGQTPKVMFEFYICVIPFFPIIVKTKWRRL